MFQRRRRPGPVGALAALLLLAWAAAPWLGAALAGTAPVRAASAAAAGVPEGKKLIALTFDDLDRTRDYL